MLKKAILEKHKIFWKALYVDIRSVFPCDSLECRFFELSETEMTHCSDNQFANPLYPVYGLG